jgi:phage terminase large subunit
VDTQTLFDTRAYDPEKTISEEKAEGMPDALINQEYLCDWNAALVGAVYGDLLDGAAKVGALEPFNHDLGNVFTSWDLGFTDSTAVWFWQVKDGGIDILDYHEAHGKPLSYYFDLVDSKPYRYIKHWLPHDARQVTLSSGVSILNQLLVKWPGQVACGPDLPLLDGIQAGRWVIQQGVRFHPRAKEGFDTLREYAYEWDEEKKMYSNKPAHNWASHCADAWRYTACVVKMSGLLSTKVEDAKPPAAFAKPLHKTYTLDQLFRDHATRLSERRRI